MIPVNRRFFLQTVAAASAAGLLRCQSAPRLGSGARSFHLSSGPLALEQNPDLLKLCIDSGVSDIWLGAFFYGHWPVPITKIAAWKKRIEAAGLACHIINIPLGHPGDSLGAGSPDFPLTPTHPWRAAVRPDGSIYAGTSLHPPATEDNVQALRQLRQCGFKRFFLDDDFRLARGPGIIGGCFCSEHKNEFLQRYGYAEKDWQDLLESVQQRKFSQILKNWVDDVCDRLTASFRAQQAAVADGELGNMAMYLGAEKAGIRLSDYRGVPLRVGELMFDDKNFNKLKNKTAELFSSLFHRRYVTPEQAFSETTAYPADQLSAQNMAAKLAISTLSDVRNTMFMSGLTPFPVGHWPVLAAAMKKQAAIHERLAGHIPRGPFKHFWGTASRYVGDDNPNSLFLASGVPFEVTEQPAKDGYTFLSDFDAAALADGRLFSPGTTFVTRPTAKAKIAAGLTVAEDLEALFALKEQLSVNWQTIPYIKEKAAAVCAWYPSAHSVLIWNLDDKNRSLTLVHGENHYTVKIGSLATELVSNI